MTIGGIGTVGEREAQRKRGGTRPGVGGGLIIRRMINYIVFGGGRSRIHDTSRRTQILGILKVWADKGRPVALQNRQNRQH